MDGQITSIKELYQRITPALILKENEFQRAGLNSIKKEDIWNYLLKSKWINGHNLRLYEIVDDIINCDSEALMLYINDFISKAKRNALYNV